MNTKKKSSKIQKKEKKPQKKSTKAAPKIIRRKKTVQNQSKTGKKPSLQKKAKTEEKDIQITAQNSEKISAMEEKDIIPTAPSIPEDIPKHYVIKEYGISEFDGSKNEENKSNINPAESYSLDDLSSIETEEAEKNEAVIDEAKPEESVPNSGNNAETEKPVSSKKLKKSVKLYKKIAIAFLFLTIFLLAIIFYFNFFKVDIVIVPNIEKIQGNFLFDVYNKNNPIQPSQKNKIPGIVEKRTIAGNYFYKVTGQKIIGEEVGGKVKIINNNTSNQPLVATTRLLTPDNKLFRINQTVNVPAGGSVTVEVYADKPSADMAIGPSKFTIPGLWAGLQNKVYAESSAKMEYKQKSVSLISNEDIANSKINAKQNIINKTKEEVGKLFKNYDEVLYTIDESTINYKIDAKSGDEAEEFAVDISADIIIVAFNKSEVADLARLNLLSSMPESKDIVDLNDNVVFTLNTYNVSAGEAAVNATYSATIIPKEGQEIVQKDKITGLNSSQLDAYLSIIPEISAYEVRYYPPFMKRVPMMKEKINIKIKPISK